MEGGASVKLWSIGGGKGGVGKSLFTLGLSMALARLGNRVILVDGDLGGANLHTMMGLRYPTLTLEHFLLRQVTTLTDLILPTPVEGIGLICGADDVLGAANPTYFQKVRLLRELEKLPADFVLIDLGAGTSYNTLDLFNYCQGRIAVFSGLTTALQNVYGFIKCALYRHIAREFAKEDEVLALLYADPVPGQENQDSLDEQLAKLRQKNPALGFRLAKLLKSYQLFLVTNMVKCDQDLRSSEIIQSVCQDFLNVKPEILGHLFYDPMAEVAINQMVPTLLYQRNNRLATGLEQIARRVLRLARRPLKAPRPEKEKRETGSLTPFTLLKQALPENG